MANAVYPKAKEALLKGDIDLENDTIKVVLCTSSYTYSTAHDFLDDITAGYRVATSSALTSKTFTSGAFDAADVTFAALTGSTVARWVVVRDTGTESTSHVIAYFDTKSGGGAISYTPNGADYILSWGSSGIFTI